MALSANSKSLFLYGQEITSLNQNLDFKIVNGGPTLTAQIPLGFYSLTSLAIAIVNAMQDVDQSNIYTVSIDRTVMGGLQNRVTISTNGSFLQLLFGSGPNAPSSVAPVIGFNPVDYTGGTSYIGSSSSGKTLLTSRAGYNFLSDLHQGKVFGAVNVAASGLKESVVFNIQKFINVEYRYEPAAVLANWVDFFTWAIQQREFDYTPEITSPSTYYRVTLEKTQYDSKGMGFSMKEMLPNYPNHFQTGPLEMRIILPDQSFLSPS